MYSHLYRLRAILVVVLCSLAWVFAPPARGAGSDFDITVEVIEGEIRAEVSLFVQASRRRVWEVITDYERAPEFMRNMHSSRIVSRSGNTIRVHQKDQVRFGPFTFPVETVKDIRMIEPTRTESRLVSGSLKKYDAHTELVSEGSGTRILYRSLAIPGAVLAAFIGESAVKRETEERFRQLRAEILRREHIAATKH